MQRGPCQTVVRAFPGRFPKLLILLGVTLGFSSAQAVDPPLSAQKIEFNKHIRPILADHCYLCHGPDKGTRQAGLRLDHREGAVQSGAGQPAIVPGNSAASELVKRITSPDPDYRMPKPEMGRALNSQEIDLLKQWIDQGAEYEPHWAYVAPRKKAMPAVRNAAWARNPVDVLILAELEKNGLSPSPEADRRTLIRRLSYDLLGLPPSPETVDAFLKDSSPQAYERLVDRLLASPHYGERMAVYWLDLVRYADTVGYHGDQNIDVWPYRDYVIRAFNDNLPFDQFTREQLAGDLLPNSTQRQKVASAYNRLNMVTREGGAQAKEYLAKYAADRVRTTSTVWLASSLGCAECHDHKFDPFSAKEFYRFAAFFADVKEQGVYESSGFYDTFPPAIRLTSGDQAEKLDRLTARLTAAEEAAAPLRQLSNDLQSSVISLAGARQQLASTLGLSAEALAGQLAEWENSEGERVQFLQEIGIALIVDDACDREKGDAHPKERLAQFFYDRALKAAETAQAAAQRAKQEFEKTLPLCVVTEAVEPRVMRVLPRGNWMDDSGEVVQPGAPSVLAPQLDGGERRLTRLDLANWLVAPDHPLTARVMVNRFWKLCFGTGLSKTLDDLGSRGEWPRHLDLLDWLAVEFQESGWDVKHVLRLLVTSAAYRQSSKPEEKLKEVDPYNRLYARQSRWRLEAEFVRDNALAISGLFVPKLGGPSVNPYQPSDYYKELNFPKRTYTPDRGENQYRRGVYTHWQRTFLHPSLAAFDAPSREECTAERNISNTPLQALALLNDPTYVEAARVFAQHILEQGGTTFDQRLRWACRRALSRGPTPREEAALKTFFDQQLADFQSDPQSAAQLIQAGYAPVPGQLDPAELAAWASVARCLLNLHEILTRY